MLVTSLVVPATNAVTVSTSINVESASNPAVAKTKTISAEFAGSLESTLL